MGSQTIASDPKRKVMAAVTTDNVGPWRPSAVPQVAGICRKDGCMPTTITPRFTRSQPPIQQAAPIPKFDTGDRLLAAQDIAGGTGCTAITIKVRCGSDKDYCFRPAIYTPTTLLPPTKRRTVYGHPDPPVENGRVATRKRTSGFS